MFYVLRLVIVSVALKGCVQKVCYAISVEVLH